MSDGARLQEPGVFGCSNGFRGVSGNISSNLRRGDHLLALGLRSDHKNGATTSPKHAHSVEVHVQVLSAARGRHPKRL